LVPRLALISAAAAMILVAQFVLVALGGTTRGPGLTLLAAVVGLSLSIGVSLGLLNARRIWSKCMPLGTYRWRTDYRWFPILILVSSVGPALYVLGMQTVLFTAATGVLGVCTTIALGMALFERRARCYLSVVRDSAFWPRWVEYRVELRHDPSAR